MKTISKNKYQALHKQFLDIIKKEIKDGRYKPSELIPSERRLVEQYNISRSTIRRAVSQLVSKGWLYSVPGTGTFVSAEALRREKRDRPRSRNISCVLKAGGSPLDSPYYSKVFKSMQDEVARLGYYLSFYYFGVESKADLINVVRDKQLDGLIIIGVMRKEIILDVYKNKIPFVLLDNYFDKRGITSIMPDNRKGMFEATEYLINLGHRKIYFLGADISDPVVAERFNGYKDALDKAGIPYKDEYFVKSNYQVADGYRSMENILKSGKLPTAILAINDEAAVGAMKAIKEKSKLKIPADISIIGFDDIDWATHAEPPLTTVRLPKEEIGSLAVSFLIKQIEDEKFSGVKIIIPTELVIRSSCSKPRG